MPTLQDYKTALAELVGEDRMSLAINHLAIAAKWLTEEKRRQIQLCSQNKDRLDLIEKWFDGFLATEVKNLLALLAEKNQLSLIDEIALETRSGQKITVSVAKPLNKETKDWFAQELQNICGKSDVFFQENPRLIGGVKIRIGDKELDYSIQTKLGKIIKS